MADRHTACACAYTHAAIREVDGVFDVSVLKEITDFLDCHHSTIVLGFFGGGSKVRGNDRSLCSDYLRICKVGHIFLHFSGL